MVGFGANVASVWNFVVVEVVEGGGGWLMECSELCHLGNREP